MELPLLLVVIISIVVMVPAYIHLLKKDIDSLTRIIELNEEEIAYLDEKIERLEELSGIEIFPLPLED